MEFEIELARGQSVSSILGDRGRFAPYGLHDGHEAAMTVVDYTLNGAPHRPSHITKDEGVAMVPGDTARLATPGGGGWGDPMQRDPAKVLLDVANEFITAESAARDYGVSVRREGPRWIVDTAMTDRLRAGVGEREMTGQGAGGQ